MRNSARLVIPLLLLPALLALLCRPAAPAAAQAAAKPFEPVRPAAWVHGITRMTFIGADEVDAAADAGGQVLHTNLVWPYYPLRKDGGGLAPEDGRKLRELAERCRRRGMKLGLGLPPFPPVALVKAHPDWRVHPDDTGAVLKLEPAEDNLGTRLGCNQGPWGDYLIEVCAELVRDYGVDSFSFDGNYHPAVCYCPACKTAYRRDRAQEIPAKVDLDDVRYREYLVWRGERLEDHYRRLQARIKGVDPDAAIITWTVNAGRYGHFLTSPRAMPSRLNLLFDMPMQEWWLDETNLGASVAPAFGAAYVRAVGSGRPGSSEPYLMSRGNPYGTDSFPRQEVLARALLAVTNGAVPALSLGWPGHADSTREAFREVAKRERWITRARPVPWAAMLVSEQTRQFYAYKDIAERFLPHQFGVFRAAMEERLPLDLLNDWDVTPERLREYRVLVLPNAAALSAEQVRAVREYVRAGGGLVATGETSLYDELGRPHEDFALADVFGVSFRGRPRAPDARPKLDKNFAVTVDESYWRQRTGVGTLTWSDTPLTADPRLAALVPGKSVRFRGPQVAVSEPAEPADAALRLTPEGWIDRPLPGVIVRRFGEGRVVYMAAGIDAALWSYAYPYQRRLTARALELAAARPFPISVQAPMCVQATFYEQRDAEGQRTVVHLFNGMNTTANHGLPAAEVPLREETVPIHGIRVRFTGEPPRRLHVEPGGAQPKVRRDNGVTVAELPPLELHSMLVAER
jgi:hypothetical protein